MAYHSTRDTVFEARNLTKTFGKAIALSNLNLKVGMGEIVCLLGADGAGKTTTLNLFLGFRKPTEGEALVGGKPVQNDPVAARAMLGYVAESVSLYPTLSGAENLAFFHALARRSALSEDRRAQLLASLDFPGSVLDRPVGTYSKGMRQKLGLAIAVAKGARAILLDEPLSGLDPKAANNLVEVMRNLREGGVALLISTHDFVPGEGSRRSDRHHAARTPDRRGQCIESFGAGFGTALP
ncbi:ABC transporter ATP-binding protein [Blastomonas sp. RAC04]|uniref:ABC transporter ATP-binding protein n=1 Tax=Blastomonas sp. RAC04 TaxID=1842535 RepID=UPI001F4722CF|nr:ABC transporter ATP-binding protein [Blastomonas sp. RAC04]